MDNTFIFVKAQGLHLMFEQMVRLVSLGIVSRIHCKSIIGNLIDVEKEEVECFL